MIWNDNIDICPNLYVVQEKDTWQTFTIQIQTRKKKQTTDKYATMYSTTIMYYTITYIFKK